MASPYQIAPNETLLLPSSAPVPTNTDAPFPAPPPTLTAPTVTFDATQAVPIPESVHHPVPDDHESTSLFTALASEPAATREAPREHSEGQHEAPAVSDSPRGQQSVDLFALVTQAPPAESSSATRNPTNNLLDLSFL